jgi:peroxiredoxin/uncharacterized membrane protein YphA (DoxX/SURF4 family)
VPSIITIVRLLLILVLLAAAVGKLMDLPGARAALVAFDVPGRIAAPGAVVLPIIELATAIALLLQPAAQGAAIVAAALFTIFTLAIGRALSAGRAPDCHCFGQIHSAPAGKRTLGRNLLLVALAAAVAIDAPGRPIDRLIVGATPLSQSLLGISLILALLLIAWLAAINQRMRRTGGSAPAPAARLEVGEAAPSFSLPDENSRLISLDDVLSSGAPVMLVFTSAICTQCQAYLPELARWQKQLAGAVTILPIAHGDVQTNLEHARAVDLRRTLFTGEDRSLIDTFAIPVTPCSLLVDPAGRVATGPIEGADALDAMLRLIEHAFWSSSAATSAATPV